MDEGRAKTLLGLLGAREIFDQKGPPVEGGLYWDARHPSKGGSGKVGRYPTSPSADFYRLVDSLEEADHVFKRGERPILLENLMDVTPETLDFNTLAGLQEKQWANPGGEPMFTETGINPNVWPRK